MKLNKNLIFISKRFFAPPKPAGKGGPASSPAYVPVVIQKTPYQRLIERGIEFPLGPPKNPQMVQGTHRDNIVPKLAPRIEVFAKKLRDFYFREGVLPEEKTFIEAVRERQPEDKIENLQKEKLVAAVIQGRDEFPDVDLVLPWSAPHLILRSDHYEVKPLYVKVGGEEIRVTTIDIETNAKSHQPYFVSLQRYIVGRPNLLKMAIYPVQEDKSLHFQAGANFNYYVKELYVWCYNDTYPARLEVNCMDLTPSFSIKIGDVERMLPHGMYLHKMYNHQKNRAVVNLTQSNLYSQRKNALNEQNYQIYEQKQAIKAQMSVEKKKDSSSLKKGLKVVPVVVQSAKFLMAEKKEQEKEAKAAEKKK
ncbi:UNKNOWN [Stylonychia lemnae]|uniref:Uncharacterized protein n=1 Tax=Stylonychia lemnae TaxID=5949 RepID=A0A077ZVC3_STYLE|nr:UNKNOWN [Stylonychia lemnae]|eukprot:CDW73589.1 UNKNOWN [Stylonychia lemnae]